MLSTRSVLLQGSSATKKLRLLELRSSRSWSKRKKKLLYRPAVYQNELKIRGPHDTYCNSFIRNALRILFFKRCAPFNDVPHEKLTIPMVAFVTALVCLSGGMSSKCSGITIFSFYSTASICLHRPDKEVQVLRICDSLSRFRSSYYGAQDNG